MSNYLKKEKQVKKNGIEKIMCTPLKIIGTVSNENLLIFHWSWNIHKILSADALN